MDYLGLNITLNSYLKDEIKFDLNSNVDDTVRKYRNGIYEFLIDEGINSTILNVIFIKDISLQKSMTDAQYLEIMVEGLKEKSVENIARMYLDFYEIEHALRRNAFIRVEGSSLSQFVKGENDSLDSVLLKSDYYKWIGVLNIDNYRKLFDEYLYSYLKENLYINIGLDGIISRLVRNFLEIDNLAILEKAKRMNLDASEIVRSYAK